jgi:hypothetical protein
MKKIKFNYILIILLALFLGIISWKFLSLLSYPDQSISFEGDSKQEKLYPYFPILQKITAKENNFNQINVSLSKFSANFGEKITLEILDEFCQNILAQSKIDGFTWNSPSYEKFKFKNISDSKEKIYCLKFTYVPRGEGQDKKAYISSYQFDGSSYTNTGNKKNSEEQKNRSLALKPAYETGSTWQNFSKLIDRMSQYKPDYIKGISLEIIFILSLVLIILTAAIIILKI